MVTTILFYSPFNQRSRDTESLMIAFQQQGHRVLSLSQAQGYLIHEYLQSKGIETFTYNVQSSSALVYFFRHIFFLIKFCRKHKVDVVYSHLEPANFVAVIAQFFIKGKVYVGRHHIDEAALSGFDQSIFYKLTYRLAKKIIVVSNRGANYMISAEKIRPSKIIKINLAYDFSLYAPPHSETVKTIREANAADVVLLTVCRLTKYKRADLCIILLKKLINSGVDAKLIVLGSGIEEQNLRALAIEEGVADRIDMPGHVQNVTDYLAAADFLIHPSVLESSCVIVKEAAITALPVLVCSGVGDFDDYLMHGQNGFTVGKDNFVEEALDILVSNYKEEQLLKSLTKNLHDKVIELFSINAIISQYETLNTSQ
jgi:glycosyltransferase involved in cell wall biosynthesis